MKRAVFVLALAACSHTLPNQSAPSGSPPAGGHAPAAAGVSPAELSPEQVRVVQRSLVDRGFAVDPTGTFDDRTKSALTDFQRARGLPATAALDRSTLDALGLDPGEVLPAGREGLGSGPQDDHDRPLPGAEPYSPSDPGPTSPGDSGRGGGVDR